MLIARHLRFYKAGELPGHVGKATALPVAAVLVYFFGHCINQAGSIITNDREDDRLHPLTPLLRPELRANCIAQALTVPNYITVT